ncbi:MAG: hypothetical protein RI953_587 [Pseudomonadota bacterium]|jgi:hypothetical protein
MKTRSARPSKSALVLVQVICGFGQLNGCGFEVENPGNPDPKPKTTTDSAKSQTDEGTNAPVSNSSTTTSPNCASVVVSKGGLNSSGKDGAVVALPETDTYANTTLIWKNTATGQEVAAKDMVFVSTAFPAGSYVFKFTSASGRSCNASVDITAYDISDNLKLTLEITVPN